MTRPSNRLDRSEPPTRDLYRAAFADPVEADHRRRSPDTPRTAAGRGAAMAAGLTLVAGVWLVIAPFMLDYAHVGGIDGYWNSTVVGALLILLALLRLGMPGRSLALCTVSAALGGWLLVAQHVLGYGEGAPRATANEVATGVLVILLGLAGVGFTLAAGRRPQSGHSGVRPE